MSDELEARAWAIVDQIPANYGMQEKEWAVGLITTALREERRRVWAEAATLLDEHDILESPDELDPSCKCKCFIVITRYAELCRQQAQEERP